MFKEIANSINKGDKAFKICFTPIDTNYLIITF